MQIKVTGTTKANAKILEEAAEFFADILMDPRMVRNIVLDIEVGMKDLDGECVDEDGFRSPRWFTIGLKKQTIDEMVKVLAHEMVHVKQHAKNELQTGFVVPARGGMKLTSKWMGETWKPKRKEHPYFDAPWEIEAFGKEVGLFQRYVSWRNAVAR